MPGEAAGVFNPCAFSGEGIFISSAKASVAADSEKPKRFFRQQPFKVVDFMMCYFVQK